MKIMVKTIILVTGIFFLFMPSAFASSTPQGVNQIIVSMDQFEKSFADYQWLDASMAIAQIRKELKQVFSESQLNDESLSVTAKNLLNSVVKKSKEETVVNYALFQKKFYTFINHFDYETPPVLSMVEE